MISSTVFSTYCSSTVGSVTPGLVWHGFLKKSETDSQLNCDSPAALWQVTQALTFMKTFSEEHHVTKGLRVQYEDRKLGWTLYWSVFLSLSLLLLILQRASWEHYVHHGLLTKPARRRLKTHLCFLEATGRKHSGVILESDRSTLNVH